MHRLPSLRSWARLAGVAACLASGAVRGAEADLCAVCGKPITGVYYGFDDKVTLQKTHVCQVCEQGFPECFVCGLPADTNVTGFVRLADQRVLCARDARTAVLGEEEGLRICSEVRDGLDRLFSRFTTFPDANVSVGLVDRVRLIELFKLAGNDIHCPNVWGFTQTTTNGLNHRYRISLMTGLPLAWFRATCAHEYAHTWIGEHLSSTRKAGLSQDAKEGFCELVSYLFMESLADPAQLALILHNPYTRGQIDLFLAADRTFGFNDILDWMQWGTDEALSAAEPDRIRKIAPNPPARVAAGPRTLQGSFRPPTPASLVLKAILWGPKKPTALINDRVLGLNEEASIRVGPGKVRVRCLSISADSVQLRLLDSGRDQTLLLEP